MAAHRHTSWFVTLPVAALALGFLWLIFFPTAKQIRVKRNDLRQKAEYIAETEAMRGAIVQSENNLNDAQAYVHQWHAQAAVVGQISKVFEKILDEVRLAGATTTRFEPKPDESLEMVHHSPVQLELAGSFVQVCNLLAALETLPETIWVEHIKIEKPHEAGKDMKCELKLEVFTDNFNKSG
ncbi:MAG TPA: type 4a pilus biogenesis protein PilO [Pirellulales bacterium]|jgi:Tfp pilus assembly protein PilO